VVRTASRSLTLCTATGPLAIDLLELDGENLRALPLGDRKKRLAKLVGKRRIGIVAGEGRW
jgi:ATP-dependent DNA ligase